MCLTSARESVRSRVDVTSERLLWMWRAFHYSLSTCWRIILSTVSFLHSFALTQYDEAESGFEIKTDIFLDISFIDSLHLVVTHIRSIHCSDQRSLPLSTTQDCPE